MQNPIEQIYNQATLGLAGAGVSIGQTALADAQGLFSSVLGQSASALNHFSSLLAHRGFVSSMDNSPTLFGRATWSGASTRAMGSPSQLWGEFGHTSSTPFAVNFP